jgi:hypothetical protein
MPIQPGDSVIVNENGLLEPCPEGTEPAGHVYSVNDSNGIHYVQLDTDPPQSVSYQIPHPLGTRENPMTIVDWWGGISQQNPPIQESVWVILVRDGQPHLALYSGRSAFETYWHVPCAPVGHFEHITIDIDELRSHSLAAHGDDARRNPETIANRAAAMEYRSSPHGVGIYAYATMGTAIGHTSGLAHVDFDIRFKADEAGFSGLHRYFGPEPAETRNYCIPAVVEAHIRHWSLDDCDRFKYWLVDQCDFEAAEEVRDYMADRKKAEKPEKSDLLPLPKAPPHRWVYGGRLPSNLSGDVNYGARDIMIDAGTGDVNLDE